MKFPPLFPVQASTTGGQVDHLYFYLIAVSAFFSALIFALVLVFAIKYRRRTPNDRATQITMNVPLEIAWFAIPLGLEMIMFFWGAQLYFKQHRAPADAEEIFVVGKQWMWKIQHADGLREINELHVPVGRRFRLVLTSEDVIHSFFVPAFRMKQDAVPGMYTSEWFEATQTGDFHLFCAEYCGTNHSRMIGTIHVMEPAAYQQWLSGGVGGESMPVAGQRIFERLGCSNCHVANGTGRCPSLVGLYGRPVKLQDGRSVMADDAYIRESILNPSTKIVAGFQNIMPTFQGQINEEQILQVIAYVRSLQQPQQPGAAVSGGKK